MNLNTRLENTVYPPAAPPRRGELRFALTDVAEFMRWSYFDLHNMLYKSPFKRAFGRATLKTRQLSSVDTAAVLFAGMMREHRWLYDEILRHVPILHIGLTAYSEDVAAGRPGPWMLVLRSSAAGKDELVRGQAANTAPLSSYGASGVWVSIEAIVRLLRTLERKVAAQFN